jgi:hypothetical protein
MKKIIAAVALLAALPAFAGTMPLLRVGLASAPTPSASTPIFSSVQLPGSGASDEFGGTQCPTTISTNCISTVSTARRIPMPFAGTINSATVVARLGTAPTAQVTMTDHINGSDGHVVCTFAIGVQTGSCTGTDSVPANAAFQWHFVTTGWNQAALTQIAFLYTANGQHVAILLQPSNSGIGASAANYGFPGTLNNATLSNVTSIICQGCAGTINAISVLPNVSENGSNVHTTSTVLNGSLSIGCSGTLSSASGCSATGSVTIASGDVISIFSTCATSCSTAFPGVSFDFTPATQNVVPVFANVTSVAAPYFTGVSDFSTTAAPQTNFQMVPAAMTFSSFQVCSLVSTTGTQTRTATLQGGSAGSAPTTTELTTTITSGTGACPGSQGATYLSGASVGGTYSAAAGSTIDNAYTVTNSPGLTPVKISAAVTVP